ncbi:unnamed protein product [Schistosoma turkestanicum]|nr:unnamed protein product [Schistosoma turkestanicum]
MDRLVRKINSSPKSKRKTLVQTEDNFGVPLKVLLDRDSTKPVPRIVKNICDYLLHYGLNSQGIFRINGSAKLIDGFKTTFQISAADDLCTLENVDIYALAGVLKLFLRELPDGLVPEKLGLKCIKIAKEYSNDLNVYILKLQTVLFTLVHENYELLKYLCKFLNKIAENEPVNKMSHNSLGIIFGPCVFRCSLDLQVLKNQGLTNYVMTSLIQYHDAIFVHHPKTDFFVLDHLFKLPELVSNSAIPNLEDRVQSSSDISTSSNHNNSPELISCLQGNKFSHVVEALPLSLENSNKPGPDNQLWMSSSSSEPKIPRTSPCHNTPDSVCDVTVGSNLSNVSSPFQDFVSSSQNKECLVCPSTSSTPSPIAFEVSSTPTFVSRNNSFSFNEENTEESPESSEQVLCTKTSEQLALDITSIISSMATSRSLETMCFEIQPDDYFNNSTQMSSCSEKPNQENSREKLRTSGVLSRSLNKVSKGGSLFNKVVHFTHVTDNPNKINRTFSHRKRKGKKSSVDPISTWNSMPSVQNETIKTSPTLMDSCVPVYGEGLCSQSAQPGNIISDTLEYNGYRFPNADNTCRFVSLQKDDFNAENVQNTPNSPHTSTSIPVSENHLYMEIPAANNEFTNLVANNQPSPVIENILTEAVNQCSDNPVFSFSVKQSPERNPIITKQRIKQQHSVYDRLLTSSQNEKDLQSHRVQLTESDDFVKSPKEYSTDISYCTQHLNTRKSMLSLSNKTHSESDLLYIKNRLSHCIKLKYTSLQHLIINELSSLKTLSNFKLINQEKSANVPVKMPENLLFPNKEEPNIVLISSSTIPVIRRVKSFSSNSCTSSIKLHPSLRKYSSQSIKLNSKDFCENSVSHNVDDDNADDVVLKRSNSSLTSIESFYELLSAVLSKQRQHCNRPERLSEMNWDQIEQEKYDIQKSLLYFEGLYGRPKSPKTKRIMKPIYERYRQVKRLISSRYGVYNEFPFGIDLSRLKVSTNNPVVDVDVNEKFTNKESNVLVSNELMDILNTSSSGSSEFVQDTIHHVNYESDSSTSQDIYKNKESNFPVKDDQRNCIFQSSIKHNRVTIENNQNSSIPFNLSHRRSFIRPDDHKIQL